MNSSGALHKEKNGKSFLSVVLLNFRSVTVKQAWRKVTF